MIYFPQDLDAALPLFYEHREHLVAVGEVQYSRLTHFLPISLQYKYKIDIIHSLAHYCNLKLNLYLTLTI